MRSRVQIRPGLSPINKKILRTLTKFSKFWQNSQNSENFLRFSRSVPIKVLYQFWLVMRENKQERNIYYLAWVGVKWERDLKSSASHHRHLILWNGCFWFQMYWFGPFKFMLINIKEKTSTTTKMPHSARTHVLSFSYNTAHGQFNFKYAIKDWITRPAVAVTILSSFLRPILAVYFSMKYWETGDMHSLVPRMRCF